MPTIVETGAVPQSAQTQPSSPQQSARERAIAQLMGGNQTQSTPVQNANQVTPEEMTVVQKPSNSGQKDTSVEAEATQEASTTSTESTSEASTEGDKEPLSAHYAQLARKEKALRAKVQAFKAQEKALADREAALAAKDAEYAQKYIDKDRLSKDPFGVLEDLGITYDQLAEIALNRPQDPAAKAYLDKLQAEIKELKAAQEEAKKTFQSQQQQQYEQAVNQIRMEAKQLVNTDPSYETVKATGQVEAVVELIKRTFDEEGTLMTVDEAAAAVEEHLVEEALRIAKLKKIQQKLVPATKTATQEPKESKQPQTQQPLKTLTNSVTSSRPLTARERAILAFKGEKV